MLDTPDGHVQLVVVVVALPVNTLTACVPVFVHLTIVGVVVGLLATVPLGNVKLPVSSTVKLVSVAMLFCTF
jgi:hypothetical protein